MNTKLLTGVMMLVLEIVFVGLFFFITAVNWTWSLITTLILICTVGVFNLVAFILVIAGLISKEEDN